ncbi:4-hydroxy-2-oxoheptanedioate aldolase [Rhodovulum iodosum]|uniref:4-hydroxy-2-oxoheptanedioate aldolase n=1 Tax=Rhodovulum iodosum TaxID=68291 RepID=A0ABV3XTS6_9RHOB|nr:HpcH/HpaI aldolase/citrate lyase family protein [Rhodovulum robiginosum]RSK32169.1 4-hydroxy-2-oxo-heptane-1,7-dioate aldolase [Rhodovulum robiginosum]
MTVQAPKNSFKSRLLAGEVQLGLWMSLGSAAAAEALSLVGYDWLLFDMEHAPVDPPQMQPLLQAAAAGVSQAVARPPWNDPVLIKRTLDVGAQTLLVPFVQSAEEAAAAVRAAKYPPQGIRGVAGLTRASRYGLAPDYFATANAQTCVLVQIETPAALSRIEEIALTPGVDGVFIGPSDLGASMGHLGRPGTAEVQDAIRGAADTLRDLQKPAGILAVSAEDAERYLDWGYSFVAIGIDMSLLLRAAKARLDHFTDAMPGNTPG